MKLTDRPKNKILLFAILTLIGLLAVIGTSLAAYTSQDAKRGVVRNRDNEVVRFASNYLQTVDSNVTEYNSYPQRIITYAKNVGSNTELTINIDVYNYVSGNLNLISEKDITYTMEIELKNTTENNQYQINDTKGVSFKEENVKFTANKVGKSSYTVKIFGNDINKIQIVATATPNSGSLVATKNQKLAAVIVPSTVADDEKKFDYSGTFIDETDSNSPMDYDALNYEVYISSGEKAVKLTWDTSLVEIDPYFLKKYNYTVENGTITFPKKNDADIKDYLIQFYWVNKNGAKNKKWSEIVQINVVEEQVVDTNDSGE